MIRSDSDLALIGKYIPNKGFYAEEDLYIECGYMVIPKENINENHTVISEDGEGWVTVELHKITGHA